MKLLFNRINMHATRPTFYLSNNDIFYVNITTTGHLLEEIRLRLTIKLYKFGLERIVTHGYYY